MNSRTVITMLCLSFLGFWTFGMTTGLASGPCVKGLSTAARTNTACKISHVGIFMGEIPQSKLPGMAVLYTGYGVASFVAGERELAEREFAMAIERGLKANRFIDLNGLQLPDEFVRAILRIMDEQVPNDAALVWWEVLEETQSAVFGLMVSAANNAQEAS